MYSSCCGNNGGKENIVKEHTANRVDEILEEIKQMKKRSSSRWSIDS